MNTNSNSYTVIYSAIMVVAVAILLSLASIALKKPQDKNVEVEKKMNILASVNQVGGMNEASDKNAYIEAQYTKYIVESYCVNTKGEKTDADAFTIDLKAEFEKPSEEMNLPVFVSDDNGSRKYIFPVRGAGLWGPIWGYVSLNDDFKTVYGATFDHKGETPGLGAEISTPPFQHQFPGKSLYDNSGTFVGIHVVKPGTPFDNNYTVDGISGGTITSKALERTVFNCLSNYKAFFAAHTQSGVQVTPPAEEQSQGQTSGEAQEQVPAKAE